MHLSEGRFFNILNGITVFTSEFLSKPKWYHCPQGRVTPDTRKFGNNLVRCLVTPHILRRIKKHGVQNFVKTKARCYLGKYLGLHSFSTNSVQISVLSLVFAFLCNESGAQRAVLGP
jgi:hypothetical protein